MTEGEETILSLFACSELVGWSRAEYVQGLLSIYEGKDRGYLAKCIRGFWIRLAVLSLLLAIVLLPSLGRTQEKTLVRGTGTLAVQPTRTVYPYNDQIYYRNKLEFSVETGDLWINIPFVFDVFVGGDYSQRPYHYTIVPIFPSIRWQVSKIDGPSFLRGTNEITASFNVTAIPRGYESIYGAFDLGYRRNFVYRDWKLAPYFECGAGAGFINAKEPTGKAPYGQGQDYTFTLSLGSGVRYNFTPRYSVSLGGRYMHVSNLYESEPKWDDNGINVVGPWIGFYMQLGKPRHMMAR